MPILATAALAVAALAPQDRARELYTKSEHQVRMRDGVELYTAVYRPRDASREHPILLKRTPYSCRPYGPDSYPSRIGPSDVAMEHGFIVVYQDVRGRYMSDGTYDNMRPHVPGDDGIDESSDTYDTVAWLLENVPGNNGRVGMWGISYPGFYAAAALPEAHPALVAVSPQAPIADFYFDDFHHRGAYFLSYFTATPVFGHQKTERTTRSWWPRPEIGTQDAYRFFLELGPLKNGTALLGEDDFFWRQLVEHPNYDEFWQARSILPHLNEVTPAVLTVGGWYDAEDLYGPLNVYRSLERSSPGTENSLVMGPWGHGDWARNVGREQRVGDLDFGEGLSEFYCERVELPFFRHHLEGAPDPGLPEALVYDTGAREWRRFDAWPPAPATSTRLHLAAGGRLQGDPPDAEDGPATTFRSDPAKPVPHTPHVRLTFTPRHYMGEDQRFASRRPDVLVFQTEPLDADVTLAGGVDAHLVVSTTGTAADWIVKLIDVWPDDARTAPGAPDRFVQAGMQEMVRSEVVRGRFREGFETPVPFEPGVPTVVDLPLQDVLHTFRAGHRIMIHVQSTWFPLIDRNPQTYVDNVFLADEEDFVAHDHTVHHSPERPSWIEVGVLPPATEETPR